MKSSLHDQFNVVAALDMTPAQEQAFEVWVRQLVSTGKKDKLDDQENGDGDNGAYNWYKNIQRPTQLPGGLAQTFVFFKKDDGKILGTGTVALEDRGVGSDNNVQQDAFLSFIQVNRDYRGDKPGESHGIGKYILGYLEAHIQGHLDQHPEKEKYRVALFSTNDMAKEMYKKVGYQFERRVDVVQFGDTEDLLAKNYYAQTVQPAASSTVAQTSQPTPIQP